MKYINRTLEPELKRRLFTGKALIVYGPRQCGKTTLLKHLTSRPVIKKTASGILNLKTS